MLAFALVLFCCAAAAVSVWGRRDYGEDRQNEWQVQSRKSDREGRARDRVFLENHHGWDDARQLQVLAFLFHNESIHTSHQLSLDFQWQGPPALFPTILRTTPQPTNTIITNTATPSTQPIASVPSPTTSSQPSSTPVFPPSNAPVSIGFPPAVFPKAPTVQPSAATAPTLSTPSIQPAVPPVPPTVQPFAAAAPTPSIPTTQPIVLPISSTKTPTPFPTITSFPTAEVAPAVPTGVPTGPGGFIHLPSYSPVPSTPPVAAAGVRLPPPKKRAEAEAEAF